jgi:hypothetical protein
VERKEEKLSWRAVQAPTGGRIGWRAVQAPTGKGHEEGVSSDAKDFPTIYGGSESLTKYIMPNGEIVENDGEKHLKVKIAEGEKFIVRTS